MVDGIKLYQVKFLYRTINETTIVQLNCFIALRYFMWSINDNFLSNITPRNLYWSTTGIVELSSFKSELWCSFWIWQKCTLCFHFGKLKPIFCSPFINFIEALFKPGYFFTYSIKKSSTYKEQPTPGIRHLTQLILKKETGRMLSCGTPISWLCKSESVLLRKTLKMYFVRKLIIFFRGSFCLGLGMTPYRHVVS